NEHPHGRSSWAIPRSAKPAYPSGSVPVRRRGDVGGRDGRPAARSEKRGGRQLVSDGAASGRGHGPGGGVGGARQGRGGVRRGKAGRAEERARQPDEGAARADPDKGGNGEAGGCTWPGAGSRMPKAKREAGRIESPMAARRRGSGSVQQRSIRRARFR